jgi:probable F420-dependent oxidoreductase
MALESRIPFGMSLPHRSPDRLDPPTVSRVAQRAEALGFRDLWVTENTLDHVFSFDPMVVLTYAAAITQRIRLGVAVVVLPLRSAIHVAHAVASLDYLSGGRAILGVGLGGHHYAAFNVPTERRAQRFVEQVELIKALWTQPRVTYAGQFHHVEGGITLKPVQQPHPPIWLGGAHPAVLHRAAAIGDGWMGAGGQSTASFRQSVALLRSALAERGRDPAAYPISKRVFLHVDERPERARAEVNRWFTEVYRNPAQTDASGIHGTPEQVRDQIAELVAIGANHLLLNPIARYEEQVEALASVVGLAG